MKKHLTPKRIKSAIEDVEWYIDRHKQRGYLEKDMQILKTKLTALKLVEKLMQEPSDAACSAVFNRLIDAVDDLDSNTLLRAEFKIMRDYMIKELSK